jgi:hypothetical protein
VAGLRLASVVPQMAVVGLILEHAARLVSVFADECAIVGREEVCGLDSEATVRLRHKPSASRLNVEQALDDVTASREPTAEHDEAR